MSLLSQTNFPEKEIFRLKVLSPMGTQRTLMYHPLSSSLFEESSGLPIFRNSDASAPRVFNHGTNPDIQTSEFKSAQARVIKIQLGYKCNLSCGYCNQDKTSDSKFTKEDAEQFVLQFQNWYKGGENGRGKGTQIEFWGGEPLIYFPLIKVLTEQLLERFPDLEFKMYSNASLLSQEMVDFFIEHSFFFLLSHDGEMTAKSRGLDPMKVPKTKNLLKQLHTGLFPLGRFTISSVLTPENHSLKKIVQHLAEAFDVPTKEIEFTTMGFMMVWDAKKFDAVSNQEAERIVPALFADLAERSFQSSKIRSRTNQFRVNAYSQANIEKVSQFCGMDRADHMSIDIKGKLFTCQGVSNQGEYMMGDVEKLDSAKLKGATHFSSRKDCQQCPVLALCRGSCMLLKDDEFNKTCQNFFVWNLSLLALSIYDLTGEVLLSVNGFDIRARNSQHLSVVDLTTARQVLSAKSFKGTAKSPTGEVEHVS